MNPDGIQGKKNTGPKSEAEEVVMMVEGDGRCDEPEAGAVVSASISPDIVIFSY